MTHAMTLFILGLVGSYLVANMLGFDFFQALLTQLVLLIFRPFAFFFDTTGPFMKKAAREGRFSFLIRVWRFSIDCVVAGGESLIFVLDKLGVG
jgi:hypothetical protein